MGFVTALVALWPRVQQAGCGVGGWNHQRLRWADETISAHCWRWHIHGVRSWPRRLVDGVALILGDENHCLESYKREVEGQQLPPEMWE
ncbi:pseudouridine synthase [Desulfovibrio desulfuricans]|nr:pseudouridine synthase [Desulfovibrio desulfuricans]